MHTASGLLAIFLKFRRKKKNFDQNKALKNHSSSIINMLVPKMSICLFMVKSLNKV